MSSQREEWDVTGRNVVVKLTAHIRGRVTQALGAVLLGSPEQAESRSQG